MEEKTGLDIRVICPEGHNLSNMKEEKRPYTTLGINFKHKEIHIYCPYCDITYRLPIKGFWSGIKN